MLAFLLSIEAAYFHTKGGVHSSLLWPSCHSVEAK
jgi:hypothetical protein